MKTNQNPFDQILSVEPDCPACKKQEREAKKIPIARILEKVDSLFAKNDIIEARRLLEYWEKEAIAIEDHSGRLSVMNELLGVYRKTGDEEKGLKTAKETLAFLEKREPGISVGTILVNAATTCKAFGKAEFALPFYEKAQTMYENAALKKDDPLFAALFNNFATALVDTNQFEKAEVYYLKAVAITEKSEDMLFDCAVSLVNLAHLYESWRGGEDERIFSCLDRAEAILFSYQGEKMSYYAFVCDKCAPSFDYFGYFATAATLKKTAEEIYART